MRSIAFLGLCMQQKHDLGLTHDLWSQFQDCVVFCVREAARFGSHGSVVCKEEMQLYVTTLLCA